MTPSQNGAFVLSLGPRFAKRSKQGKNKMEQVFLSIPPRTLAKCADMRSRNFARAFGVVVRRYRKARNLSQETLAERADLAPKMISLIERFQRNPTVNVADSLAEGLSVPLWRLVKDAEELKRSEKR
jgi:ribosome-binding protein aMBF1 (putative translation factor)